MFLNNAVYNFLNSGADNILLKKGTNYLKENPNPKVYWDQKIRILVIEFERQTVTINYVNAFELDSISCSCRQESTCHHAMAAILHLAKTKDDELLVPNPEIQKLYADEWRATPEYKKESQKIKTNNSVSRPLLNVKVDKLSSGPVSEYKLLPFRNVTHFRENLKYLRSEYFPDFVYDRTYRLLLYYDNVLEVKWLSINSAWGWNIKSYRDEFSIFIKHDNDQIYVKCGKCDLITTKFCKHLSEALSSGEVNKYIFSKAWRDAHGDFVKLAKMHKMPLEKLKDIYALEFDRFHTNPQAVKINKNYFNTEELSQLLEPMGSTEKNQSDKVQLLSDRLVTAKTNWANGLLWDVSSSNDPFPLLLEGSINKAGNKFIGNISQVSQSYYLTREKKAWFQRLEEIQFNPVAKTIDWDEDLILNYLRDSIDTLSEFINYYYSKKYFTGNFTKNNVHLFTFSRTPASLEIHVSSQNEFFYKFQYYLRIGQLLVPVRDENLKYHPCFVINGGIAHLFDKSYTYSQIKLLETDHLLLDKENLPLIKRLAVQYAKKFHVELPEELRYEKVIPKTISKVLFLKDAGPYVIFDPKLEIDDDYKVSIPTSSNLLIEVENERDSDKLLIISEDAQDEFISFLENSHPLFETSYQQTGVYYLEVKEMVRDAWFLDFFEKCRQKEIRIYGQENLNNFKFNTHPAKVNIRISSGIDWFDVDVNISFGNKKLGLKQWVEAVTNNEKYVLLDDGSLGLIPDEWYEKLKNLRMVGEADKHGLKISKYRVGALDDFFDELKDDQLYLGLRDKIQRIQNHDFVKSYPLPKSIKAELRDYQVFGYQWLKTLHELNFGACLADDMGLGKTLQVLCLLADQKENKAGTSMVIVPRSLLFNWASEIEKFCPSLKYLNYHGLQRRELTDCLMDYDLVITTYDTATNDIEILKEIRFNYIILDESQAIKNPASQRYKAMRLLNAANRIVMTGTPIENNTFDLYAQFSFVNPGIFGSQQSFKAKFALPIDKNGDVETANLLKKIINPFLLRRTKEQVAKDLPDRVENVIYCDMNKEQRKFYDALKDKIREELQSTIKLKGFANSKLKVIEGLLRLRQVCNAPQLVDPGLPSHKRESVKIETLMDIVENDLAHHNALIFSQFTSMLDLIRKELDAKKIKYAYLDGSTADRKAAVNYFEKNDDIQLFLISLKAGNTGLNLIKADYVYLIDPWWNPAVEAQAIDRTHRIGQTNNVFAYRFICKDTIEEKILDLQNKKKKLASDLIMVEENIFKSLDMDDIMDLFN